MALIMGFALSSLLTRAVTEWEWENTAAIARHQVKRSGLDALFTVPPKPDTRERWKNELASQFTDLPEIVRVKVWDRNATVLWSDEERLIGQRFPHNEELERALAGRVEVAIKRLTKPEQSYERRKFATLAEVYVPIFSHESGQIVGAVEIYKTPDRLYATIRWGRIVIWTISLGGGLALYLVLLPLVQQVYGRQVREVTFRAYTAKLEREVAEQTQELKKGLAERKRVEEALRQAQKMEAVGRLAGGVAHDFNNLLTVILGRSQLVLDTVRSEPSIHHNVELIQSSAARAAELTQQLLAFSRGQVLAPRVLDLNAIVADMEKILRRLIGEDVDLVTVPDPTIGRVRADPGQLRQVIMNLALNARDAMPEGGKLTIETTDVEMDQTFVLRHVTVRPGRYVMLAVSDTGMGMDEHTKSRLFEPFFTTKEPGKGTGLGLSTVYGIVKQSDGHVSVYSEPGKGATFKIYLPRVEQAVEQTEARPALADLPRGSETILLVEDEGALRELARESLQMLGYAVLPARHGKEALQFGRRHTGPIHLLVTDVVMPEMNGRELAGRLAGLRSDVKALYMSGYAGEAVVRHGVLDNGNAFLQKPFTVDVLARKVREVLDANRTR
jgi:signal transduction histidine kinase/ActR/RegA family two-component response regulator